MNAPLEAARKKVNALLRRNFSCEDAPADEFEGEDIEIAQAAVEAFLEEASRDEDQYVMEGLMRLARRR